MEAWDRLTEELEGWRADGRTATLWWRDDDARQVTPALERLLALSHESDTPVALAVIPRDAGDDLRRRLGGLGRVSVLQHGWGHDNHAPAADRQIEYGPHRPLGVMLDELAAGAARIRGFAHGIAALVAPWNRIDDTLVPLLPGAGVVGLSVLGPRPARVPIPGLVCANVHIDIMNWAESRFAGVEAAVGQMLDHLRRRRSGEVDASEPTGLMTHHLFHDDGCWWFIGELIRRTRTHPAVRWLDGGEVFAP
jgi:hypothetical protein